MHRLVCLTLQSWLSSSWCLAPLVLLPIPFWAPLMYWAMCLLILATIMPERSFHVVQRVLNGITTVCPWAWCCPALQLDTVLDVCHCDASLILVLGHCCGLLLDPLAPEHWCYVMPLSPIYLSSTVWSHPWVSLFLCYCSATESTLCVVWSRTPCLFFWLICSASGMGSLLFVR